MTSETRLREIAATAIREHLVGDPLNAIFEDVCCEQSLDPEAPDAQRIRDLIRTWPILDLPVPDRDGCLCPLHGRNYGHVRLGAWGYPHPDPTTPCITIARGGPGKASSITPMRLTRAEALELASLLTAAAKEEA